MQNAGIVQNRLKFQSIIKNARAFLRMEVSGISFSDYIWQFVGGKTVINTWPTKNAVTTSTEQSNKMTKEQKKYGIYFVGSTICYAFMQAVGMFNDHATNCFCYESSNVDAK